MKRHTKESLHIEGLETPDHLTPSPSVADADDEPQDSPTELRPKNEGEGDVDSSGGPIQSHEVELYELLEERFDVRLRYSTGLARDIEPTDIPEEILDDWNWVFERLESGELQDHVGRYVAIVDCQLVGVGDDPDALREEVANKLTVETSRLVVAYIPKND